MLGQDNLPYLDDIFFESDNSMHRDRIPLNLNKMVLFFEPILKNAEYSSVIKMHGLRVHRLTEALGRVIGLPENEFGILGLFSKLHDIGKLGIPMHILEKPGRLSDAEYLLITQHSKIGYWIARSCRTLFPIADWILKHHERWDGEGYPLRLKGEDIPLASRILSIADAYDAMTSDRPYRKALTKKEALAELERCAGSQFDPYLVKYFLRIATDQ